MRALLCLCLILNGCTLQNEFTRQCENIPCLGPVYADFKLNCETLEENYKVATELITRFIPKDEVCSVFSGVPVTVQLDYFDGGDQGSYDAFTGIRLDHRGKALLHEMLHRWDSIHWALGTIWHTGWDTNGYYEQELLFLDAVRPGWGLQ